MNRTTFLHPSVTQRLNNGLTVILSPITITDAVTVDVWVRTGGRNEPSELLGISHFLEHMVFKGTETLGPGALDRAIEGRGGVTNASTGQDYTHFFITVAEQDLADTLPYLTEVVTQAAIPADEFERERQVVLEEMRRSGDNPDYLAYQQLLSTVYPTHPYGRPVLGSVESVTGLTPDHLRAYHRGWYHPEHMTVVVVGKIDPETTLHRIEQFLGEPATTSAAQHPIYEADAALSGIRRVDLMQPRLEQARLLLSWPTVSVRHWDHACALEVLSTILADGRTSRLVHRLREQRGWVRGIGSSSHIQQDAGLFTVRAYLDPSYLEVVEQAILEEISLLQQELVSPEELERARRILLNEFFFSSESPSQLASIYGYYDSIGGLQLAQQYLDRVASVQASEIRDLAQQYLSTQDYVVTTMRPEEIAASLRFSKALALR